MPRTPRLDFPGARHHVMNRAIRSESMFLDDATCALFTDALAETPGLFGAKIHGFALMPNHYHLLVEVPEGNLSAVMKHIGAVFTQAFNRQHDHEGPVFRGRYRNRLVDEDAYWMHLLAYLHLNPVRAHLAARPEDCIWTSHNAYIDAKQAPGWLTRSEMIGLFGSEQALAKYIDDVRLKRRSAPSSFDDEQLWRPSSTAAVPATEARQKRTPDEAIADVAAVAGVPVDAVCTLQRGRTPNRTAWVAVWWLLRSTSLNQTDVGKLLRISRGRVSQLLSKYHGLLNKDPEVLAWSGALEDRWEATSTGSAKV